MECRLVCNNWSDTQSPAPEILRHRLLDAGKTNQIRKLWISPIFFFCQAFIPQASDGNRSYIFYLRYCSSCTLDLGIWKLFNLYTREFALLWSSANVEYCEAHLILSFLGSVDTGYRVCAWMILSCGKRGIIFFSPLPMVHHLPHGGSRRCYYLILLTDILVFELVSRRQQ